ncbi:hypothetical protein Drorol1_Dr00015480 [Drosera rotundifolia]
MGEWSRRRVNGFDGLLMVVVGVSRLMGYEKRVIGVDFSVDERAVAYCLFCGGDRRVAGVWDDEGVVGKAESNGATALLFCRDDSLIAVISRWVLPAGCHFIGVLLLLGCFLCCPLLLLSNCHFLWLFAEFFFIGCNSFLRRLVVVALSCSAVLIVMIE